MAKIWRNRLIASVRGESNRTYAEVPNTWKQPVKALLLLDVDNGIITAEEYEQIVGEAYH